MDQVTEYIESGILELYVMGLLDSAAREEVEKMAQQAPLVQMALEDAMLTLEQFAMSNAIVPNQTIKASVFATIHFKERMRKGLVLPEVPEIHANSRAPDFDLWLQHPEFQFEDPQDEIVSYILSHTPERTSLLVNIPSNTPPEIHTDEHETFFILEGSCMIHVGKKSYALKPGDFFEIPLHLSHYVEVTSASSCKAIIQRCRITS